MVIYGMGRAEPLNQFLEYWEEGVFGGVIPALGLHEPYIGFSDTLAASKTGGSWVDNI